jgi:hypothetical protein
LGASVLSLDTLLPLQEEPLPIGLETDQILELGKQLLQLLPPSLPPSSQPGLSTLEMDVDMARDVDSNPEKDESMNSPNCMPFILSSDFQLTWIFIH